MAGQVEAGHITRRTSHIPRWADRGLLPCKTKTAMRTEGRVTEVGCMRVVDQAYWKEVQKEKIRPPRLKARAKHQMSHQHSRMVPVHPPTFPIPHRQTLPPNHLILIRPHRQALTELAHINLRTFRQITPTTTGAV
jgi:hypothetical protein